jgi:probable phosphoglycerate mutase
VTAAAPDPVVGSGVEGAPDPIPASGGAVGRPPRLPVARHRVWLVRHAPTSWTGRRWCGRADPALTAAGRGLAARLAAELAAELPDGIAIRSSPARRARATARAIAGANRPVTTDDDLLEVDIGAVEGLTWDELEASRPALAAAIVDRRPVDWPGGETAAGVEERAWRAAARIAGAAREGPVLAVSHGALIDILRRVLVASGLVELGAAAHDPAPPVPAGGVVRLVPVDPR